jgi:prepilin signal peptidase PulO-like enzyme (type II secretory pathway)
MHQPIVIAVIALAGLVAGSSVALSLDHLYAKKRPRAASRSIRWRIVLLAVATGLLWCAAALRAIDPRHFVLMAAFGTALLALTATDFERHLLPNRLLYPALLLALVLSSAWPARPSFSGLFGGAAGFGLMLLVFLLLPGFGFGDVKLAGLIGLILGFPGVISGLLAGVLLGGAGAAWLLVSRRARLRTAIAYGPYLACGAIVEMLLRR